MQENKLLQYVNYLYDAGGRAAAGEPNGISEFDQEILISKIIKATPHFMLPLASDIDQSKELLDHIGRYLDSHDLDDMTKIVDYLVEKTVEYYKPIVTILLEGKNARSRTGNIIDIKHLVGSAG